MCGDTPGAVSDFGAFGTLVTRVLSTAAPTAIVSFLAGFFFFHSPLIILIFYRTTAGAFRPGPSCFPAAEWQCGRAVVAPARPANLPESSRPRCRSAAATGCRSLGPDCSADKKGGENNITTRDAI